MVIGCARVSARPGYFDPQTSRYDLCVDGFKAAPAVFFVATDVHVTKAAVQEGDVLVVRDGTYLVGSSVIVTAADAPV